VESTAARSAFDKAAFLHSVRKPSLRAQAPQPFVSRGWLMRWGLNCLVLDPEGFPGGDDVVA
jgi:hypothetical protein